MRAIMTAMVLLGCGAASHASGPETHVRSDVACTETLPTGEGACVASPGCSWGPPLWCSGVAREDESAPPDRTRPCVCTCEADVLECASRP